MGSYYLHLTLLIAVFVHSCKSDCGAIVVVVRHSTAGERMACRILCETE